MPTPKLHLKFKSLMYSIILSYSTWHWNRWGIFWLDQYPVGLFSYWLHSSATLTYRVAEIGKPRYRTCRLDPDLLRQACRSRGRGCHVTTRFWKISQPYHNQRRHKMPIALLLPPTLDFYSVLQSCKGIKKWGTKNNLTS